MTRQLYHLANIREFLTEGFNDRDLRRLCYDVPDFRPVHKELAEGTGQAEIVDLLIEHAEKTLQLDTLLALAKERNPARYEKHGPYYVDDPMPALQRQVSDLVKRLSTLTSPTALSPEQQYQVALHWVDLGRKDSLRNFDLRNADLRAADLREANLAFADLSSANLSGADLSEANLQWANLTDADLTAADLGGRGEYRPREEKHDEPGARLDGANLSGANLRKAKVNYSQLAQAKTLEGAIMPNGKKFP